MTVSSYKTFSVESFQYLSDQVLNLANQDIPRFEFIHELLKMLKSFSGCSAVGLRIRESDKYFLCEITGDSEQDLSITINQCVQTEDKKFVPYSDDSTPLELACRNVFLRRYHPSLKCFTAKGSFWTGEEDNLLGFCPESKKKKNRQNLNILQRYESVALVPIYTGRDRLGILQLKSKEKNSFDEQLIELYEEFAQILGIALSNQLAQAALRERVKELNCLYSLSKLAAQPDISLDEIFRNTVNLIPPAWQYPEITCARIVFRGIEYITDNFKETQWEQKADINIDGTMAGACKVYYTEKKPEIDEGPFMKEEKDLLNAIVSMLGSIVEYQEAEQALWKSEHALQERVKELTCLYSLALLGQEPSKSLDEILKGVANLIPPAWQYPEITHGRIILDKKAYCSSGFKNGAQSQTSGMFIRGEERGRVEVYYENEMPEIDEGPFLKEERNLIDTIAKHVGLIIERREAEQEQMRLQEQLRHADRLATIGQLAAGVAHELNEPLGNILGFAQLAIKSEGLGDQAGKDIGKIVSASLYAREIIKKLMLFSRQTPPKKTRVDLNDIVKEGIEFLKLRAANEGVKINYHLSPKLPKITADSAQLIQVTVNLVVNAIQAMPKGGILTIQTAVKKDWLSLRVEDNGLGMREEVKKNIFLPFFTTKDVGQGTGLGLAVVHGIVKSHGGTIHVTSQKGKGSCFEIKLPIQRTKEKKKE
jgi:two-component system NtrC family sensor kinase